MFCLGVENNFTLQYLKLYKTGEAEFNISPPKRALSEIICVYHFILPPSYTVNGLPPILESWFCSCTTFNWLLKMYC